MQPMATIYTINKNLMEKVLYVQVFPKFSNFPTTFPIFLSVKTPFEVLQTLKKLISQIGS